MMEGQGEMEIANVQVEQMVAVPSGPRESMYSQILPPERTSYDDLYQILIVGKQGVGKTALVKRLCTNEFLEEHVPTLGKASLKCRQYLVMF